MANASALTTPPRGSLIHAYYYDHFGSDCADLEELKAISPSVHHICGVLIDDDELYLWVKCRWSDYDDESYTKNAYIAAILKSSLIKVTKLKEVG